MAKDKSNQGSFAGLLDKYRYLGVMIALIGGAALVLVIFKDIIFGDGGGESTLGTNSFIAIAAVGILIIFAIVVDARSKNRALTERAEKLGEMAKRMYTTVEELNAANEELARAHLQADFASQAKSSFITNLGDEIESPIKAILSDVLDLQRIQDLSDAQLQAVNSIALNGEKLSAVIADIVEISRIEAGDVEFASTDFDLSELMAGLGRDGEARFDRPDAAYGAVNGDPRLLRDVLEFLLNNAADANKEGAVQFSLTRQGENEYAFAVGDEGPGLSPDALTHLFEPFYHREGERAKGVVGLRFAIADKKVAIMGGELKCESEPGKGCRFSFAVSLPAAAGNLAANG